jgi:hypothetical protein
MTVDDGFSGGYCRCTHCKAITLVPPVLGGEYDEPTKTDRPQSPPGKRRPTGPGTHAAKRPAGPGGTQSSPSPGSLRPSTSAGPAKRARRPDRTGLYLILGAVIVSVLLLAVVAWLQFAGKK